MTEMARDNHQLTGLLHFRHLRGNGMRLLKNIIFTCLQLSSLILIGNPEVREAVCEDVIRYWFKRGCDGFRLDAIDFISKPPVLEDLPITQPEYKYQPGAFNLCANGPRMHEYYQQMGKLFEEYGAITVGEAGQLSEVEDILEVVGVDRKEFNMIFQFDVLRLWGFPESDKYSQVEWTKHNIEGMKYLLKKYQTPLVEGGGWFCQIIFGKPR